MPRSSTTVLSVLCVAFAATVAHADAVSIPAARDNTLYDDAAGALSNGAGQHFFAGTTGSGLRRRGLLRFPVAESLPAGATITGVELHLNVSQAPSPAAHLVSLHRVLADWGEGTSDAASGEGAGAPSTANDATWLHTFYPGSFWVTPGGDFVPAASAAASVSGLGPYVWTSTPGLVADAQFWQANPALNFGWLLFGNEGVAASAKRFDSRTNPDLAVRPVLVIEYELSVPVLESSWGRVKALTR